MRAAWNNPPAFPEPGSKPLDFTSEQLQAIDTGRLGEDACIVAGPGSGKTTVLVERYRQLVAQGVEPSEILAITFTEKAAANMRDRLAREFAQSPELLRKLERAYVSTIHGFCSRLLKENATVAGIDPEFTILDEQLAVLEQARCLRDALDEVVMEDPAAIHTLMSVTGGADLEAQLPGIYDALRAAGMRPDELRMPAPANPSSFEGVIAAARQYIAGFAGVMTPAQSNARDRAREWLERALGARTPHDQLALLQKFKSAFNLQVKTPAKGQIEQAREEAEDIVSYLLDQAHQPSKELLIRIIERFDDLYRSRKTARAALDFNDLEFFSVRLLEENSAIRAHVNQQFRLVMIDEFQDTSAQQARLVNLVRAPGRFYAVGDLNQSIYSFRHASPQVFEDYRSSVLNTSGHSAELIENWRSREPVLLATKLILKDAPGIAERDLIPARTLPPRHDSCIEVLVFERNEEEDDYALEAAWVTHRILELHRTLRIGEQSRPALFSDFAVLVRNTGVLAAFTEAFERAGIDYNLNRRSGFLETREARDLLHLLRMIHNPRDEASTLVVLRSDLAGISDEGLLRLKNPNRNFGDGLIQFEALQLSPEDLQRMRRFTSAWSRWRAAVPYISLDRLLLRALDEMGVVWDAQTARGTNIEKFLAIARAYCDMTLVEFLTHVDAMRKADPRETEAPIDETRDAVQIMTAHAAKGLEFPVVILAAMDKGVDGSRQSVLNFTPEHGLGVKWSLAAGQEPSSGFVHTLNKDKLKITEEREANRLLYVAMTRAQEHLILTWTQDKKGPANWAKTVNAALGLSSNTLSIEPESKTYTAPNQRSFDVRCIHTAELPPPSLTTFHARGVAESEVLAKPLPTGQFDSNTTATALATFASCPRKYYLSGFLGWSGLGLRSNVTNNVPATSVRASDIGSQVHQLLAGLPVESPDLEAMRLARVFEQSALGKKAFRNARREMEWDFVFALDPLIVRGTIDLWFEDAQGITLVDYKTDSVTPEQAIDRARDHALQLQVYALALEKASGKPPQRAWLHFLRPDVVVPVPIESARDTVATVARQFMHAQQSIQFPLVVGPHCRRCEFYRGLCPARESGPHTNAVS